MNVGTHYHRTVVGYHGCDRSVAEDVLLRGGTLTPSKNEYDWLGEGIYFWEYGPRRAFDWALWKQTRGDIQEPFVLGALIHLGRCFDLTDVTHTRMLSDSFRDFERLYQGAVPRNREGAPGDVDLVLRDLDCAVLNWYLGEFAKIDPSQYHQTVRGVFVEGGEVYPGSGFRERTHVQVAVRDSNCILGFFSPYRGFE